MKTFLFFIFFTSVRLNPILLAQDIKAIRERGHDVDVKIFEAQRTTFEFFGIKSAPALCIFEDGYEKEMIHEYKGLEQIKDFI